MRKYFLYFIILFQVAYSQTSIEKAIIHNIISNPELIDTLCSYPFPCGHFLYDSNSIDYKNYDNIKNKIVTFFQNEGYIINQEEICKEKGTNFIKTIKVVSNKSQVLLFFNFIRTNKLVFVGNIKCFNPNTLKNNYNVIDTLINNPEKIREYSPEAVGLVYKDDLYGYVIDVIKKEFINGYQIYHDSWCLSDINNEKPSHQIEIISINSGYILSFVFGRTGQTWKLGGVFTQDHTLFESAGCER